MRRSSIRYAVPALGVLLRGPATMAAMSTKDSVRALLDRLPDDCSLEDVLYHLYVVQQVELGLAEADAGNVIPHEQVVQELERRWILGAE